MSDPATLSPSDNHLLTIGRLCLAWATLNRKLTDVASALIGAGPETAACLFPGTENLKPRCESIKKLVVLLLPGRKIEWRERMFALIKEIQEPLARDRNRYVHDEWHELPGAISRIELNAWIDRSDTAAGPRLETGKWHIDTTEDIERLIVRIKEATHLLSLAAITISDWKREDRPPEPFWQ